MTAEVSIETVHTFRQSDAVEFRFVTTPVGDGILWECQKWQRDEDGEMRLDKTVSRLFGTQADYEGTMAHVPRMYPEG